MNILHKFLSWSFTNANDKRELVFKKEALRQRMLNVHMIDTELERGFCEMRNFFRYGDGYFYSLKLGKEGQKCLH